MENAPGTIIDQKILKAMNRSQLYVGIFGNQYSEPTVGEFHEALRRGMNPLVYYYTEPPVGLVDSAPTPTKPNKVYTFLMEQVKTIGILIMGNYKRINIRTQSELENAIVTDLTGEVIEMIKTYHNVQKAMKGY